MIIDRTILVEQLVDFSQKGHGVIIGKPGIGKSYAITELAQRLASLKTPVVIFSIDMLLDGSDESIQQELEIQENWLTYLDRVKLNEGGEKAVLIFDAFDAAREDVIRKQFLVQIKKAILYLKKWNILVTVRTYDALKSPQLLDLFKTSKSNNKLYSRHFEVEDLTTEELESVFKDHPSLERIYSLAGDELKSILKIPFFLRLLELVLEGGTDEDFDTIKLIKSQTELLDKYWEKKITNSENSYEKEFFLKNLSDVLLSHKTLSFPKDSFIKESEVFKDLRSNDLINEVGVNDRYIAFSHNILFDYIIGRLSIPPEPQELLKFILEDKSRPFFLRPSFLFHFTRLWNSYRKEFWENYELLATQEDEHIILFTRLLPTSVIANEFETVEDLQKVLSSIKSTKHLLQSIRFLNERKLNSRDIELLHSVSLDLKIEFLWDFGFILERAIKDDKFKDEPQKGKLGEIARNFFYFILAERIKRPEAKFSLDRLASTRGVEFITRTFATNKDESRRLILQVLDFLNEPDFEIWYFSSLADDIEYLVEYDSALVRDIYNKIFSHKEESSQKTNFGTVTMNLVSNRRQDFEMCYYRLIDSFPKFLKNEPKVAIKTGLEIVNQYVIRDKLHFSSIDEHLEPIKVGSITTNFLNDLSSIWGDSLAYHKPVQLGEKIINFIEGLITGDKLEEVQDLLTYYISSAVVGFTWKKLIELGNKYPEVLKETLFELTLNPVILTSSDTTYEIGIALQKIFPMISAKQRTEVENVILKLSEGKVKEKEYLERDIVRLLNCIPKDLLALEASKEIISNSEEVVNEPTFRTSWSSEPYTTEKWLADQGVDVANDSNKEVIVLQDRLSSFNQVKMNDVPHREEFKLYLPVAEKLFRLITLKGENYQEDLRFSALREIAQFYSIITRSPIQVDDLTYKQGKEAILFLMSFYSKHDESPSEVKSAASGYSPTPRIEAASALTNLLTLKNEEDIFNLIKESVIDPNPVVRFNTLRNISQVWLVRPEEFWKIIYERLSNEPDSFTLATILNNIYRLIEVEKEIEQLEKAILIVSNRIGEFGTKNSLYEFYSRILLYLVDRKKNEFAKGFIYKGAEDVNLVDSLLFVLFDFIDPKYPQNIYSNQIHEELIQLLHDITQANLIALKNKDLRNLEEESIEQKRLKIIDYIVQRIYFSLDINESIRQHDEFHPDEENKRLFYQRIKLLLINIINNSNEIGGGIIIAHTAHYFIEVLNGVLKLYSEDTKEAASILEMVFQITQLSYKSGYTFDPSSIKEVVNLTEVLLADHKILLRDDKSLNHLVSILNIYVESGWSEALELLWKLDEVFK